MFKLPAESTGHGTNATFFIWNYFRLIVVNALGIAIFVWSHGLCVLLSLYFWQILNSAGGEYLVGGPSNFPFVTWYIFDWAREVFPIVFTKFQRLFIISDLKVHLVNPILH